MNDEKSIIPIIILIIITGFLSYIYNVLDVFIGILSIMIILFIGIWCVINLEPTIMGLWKFYKKKK